MKQQQPAAPPAFSSDPEHRAAARRRYRRHFLRFRSDCFGCQLSGSIDSQRMFFQNNFWEPASSGCVGLIYGHHLSESRLPAEESPGCRLPSPSACAWRWWEPRTSSHSTWTQTPGNKRHDQIIRSDGRTGRADKNSRATKIHLQFKLRTKNHPKLLCAFILRSRRSFGKYAYSHCRWEYWFI